MVAALPTQYRQAIELTEFQGLSQAELAASVITIRRKKRFQGFSSWTSNGPPALSSMDLLELSVTMGKRGSKITTAIPRTDESARADGLPNLPASVIYASCPGHFQAYQMTSTVAATAEASSSE